MDHLSFRNNLWARKDHGLNRWGAIINACRQRLLLIMMTTLAMIGGLMTSNLRLITLRT